MRQLFFWLKCPPVKLPMVARGDNEQTERGPVVTVTATDRDRVSTVTKRDTKFVFTILKKWLEGGYQFDLEEAVETIKKRYTLKQATPILNLLYADFAESGDIEDIRKVAETITFLQVQEKHKVVEMANLGEFFEPLRNSIFDRNMFDSNEKLHNLRNTIAAAIDMGDEASKYGDPQEVRIKPDKKNEWFYIMKAIEEAGVCKSDITVPDFIDQMMEWFPDLFKNVTSEKRDDFKRNCSRSFSAERKNWEINGVEVTLKDMWLKQNEQVVTKLGANKANRIFKIASSGLYVKLTGLKRSIVRQENGWN